MNRHTRRLVVSLAVVLLTGLTVDEAASLLVRRLGGDK